jgi:hypothetical protein
MNNFDRSDRDSDVDRRNFLKSCGRFASTVPPAMTVMLSTSLRSKAIAKSTGAGDTGHGDTGHGDGGQVIPTGSGDTGGVHAEGGGSTVVRKRDRG